jgi:hypothetical protein
MKERKSKRFDPNDYDFKRGMIDAKRSETADERRFTPIQ